MGTTCPTIMAEQSTCKAQCKFGGAPNGTFMCLASRIRLKSVCPGQDSVTLGHKVLFTLAAVASKCPSQKELITILVNALEVHKETLDGVFCQAAEEVPLPAHEAVLLGQPKAHRLIIGGELHPRAGADAQNLMPRTSQLADTAVAVGNNFTAALREAVDYVGYVKQLHPPVLVAAQVIDFHKTCRGDSALPFGGASMGTDCPATMVQGSTCTAQCSSGAPSG